MQTHATSYNFYSVLLYTVKEKGGKPDRKPPHPFLYGLRNPYGNLKSENSPDYARKPQRNCTFMNTASGVQSANITGTVATCSPTFNMYTQGYDETMAKY